MESHIVHAVHQTDTAQHAHTILPYWLTVPASSITTLSLRNNQVGVDNNTKWSRQQQQADMLQRYKTYDNWYNNMKCDQTHGVVAIHNDICNKYDSTGTN